MAAPSRRLTGALALALALTVGADLGAAVRGSHVVVRRVASAQATPTPSSDRRSDETPAGRAQQAAIDGGFAFFDPPGDNGEVDRWNPCVPIHYVTDVSVGPPTAAADISWAFEQLSAATGLQFVDDGATTEQPSDKRKDVRHTKAGWRWAPVLVSLVPDTVFHGGAALAADKDSLAYTDPAIYRDKRGDSQIVTAQVVVDADDVTDGGHKDPGALGPTLLHEFGHLVGLDHVRRKGEIMQPDGGGVTAYGVGDLAGLAYLGAAHGCIGDSALPTDSSDFPH